MAVQSIVGRLVNSIIAAPLIVAASVLVFPACASQTGADAPPHAPTSAEAPPTDGGLPMTPLHRKGVVVPSDVKLEAAPSAAAQPTAVVPGTTATPTAN